ncbi:MAG: hypothetical protein AB7O44_29180 [Hyphomicrobiaceae bacterium]
MRDLVNNIGPYQALAPAVYSGTSAGLGVDLQGFESATIVIETGAIVGAGNYTASIEESDTGLDSPEDFDAVAAGDLIGTLPETLEEYSTYKIGYRGHQPYVRVVLTKNSGTSIAVAATVVRGHPHEAPVA